MKNHSHLRRNSGATLLVCIAFVALAFQSGHAAKLVPPQDPSQSITYWKPHALDAKTDSNVHLAHEVFSVLLRSWDDTRVAPDLYVVQSDSGPWAASLSDGNILLSRSAIDICIQFGVHRARHLLAFILSHELAHQRADDLWHQKFFRLAGTQTPAVQNRLLSGISLDEKVLFELEQKEAQADHDGLLIMASVGFDATQVLGKKDFFTVWVENLWQASCEPRTTDPKQSAQSLKQACKQAKIRALRTKTTLETVAYQSSLYELGVQAYVAGQYSKAQSYFKAYGKDYINPIVHTSIGLSYLAEAVELYEQHLRFSATKKLPFYFPLRISPQPIEVQNTTKRGQIAAYRTRISKLSQHAVSHFENAIRLNPRNRMPYLWLSVSYLLDNNTFMSRGILQGKFKPQFGDTPASKLLLAITAAMEKNHKQAKQLFKSLEQWSVDQLINTKTGLLDNTDTRTLSYAIFANYAAYHKLRGHAERAQRLWKKLASIAKKNNHNVLFQLSVAHLNPDQFTRPIPNDRQTDSFRPGKKINLAQQSPASATPVWINGEKLTHLRFDSGRHVIADKDGNILSASQDHGSAMTLMQVAINDTADRPFKAFGLPSRHIHLTTGDYLAYDHLGLAIRIVNQKIVGWFYYSPT